MADIREQIAQIICEDAGDTWDLAPETYKEDYRKCADQILNIKCSHGGGVCPECSGTMMVPWGEGMRERCPTCKGKGQKPIETKKIREIIEEWENGF